ncbi:XRE family transcriptional regulator [Streptomyces sp. NPDC059618]|uniref:XRE family transcriptional regulator n=1 Tax=Streptomyces sp. NPDC059618 TaxID=3346887 RepID=UPI00367F470B
MPRWKALPDELDPRVTEFVGRLRLLVDGSGLDLAAVADRTGYGRTSWERYLNGGLLAPKGAVVALAEVTGESPVQLVTLWEQAERAWSRSETRHESALEAMRMSRARPAAGPGQEPRDARPADAGPGGDPARRKRRRTVLLAGAVGVLVVVAAVLWLSLGHGKKPASGASKAPAASASARPDLPAGVKCAGASCAGKDPELMGCGGRLATTATSVTLGTALVEVRYSETCGVAWARLGRARAGDRVELSTSSEGKGTLTAVVGTDPYTYTPMVAVKDPGSVKACVVLKSGPKACTS